MLDHQAHPGRRWTERLTFAALLLLVAGRCLVPMDETDLYFNLRLGEIVLHEHHVPVQNLLSFTHPEARDVNLAWLFQIVLALAHRAGGIAGTVLLKTGFVLLTVTLLWRVGRRRGVHPAVLAPVLALAAWAAEPRFVERPHLVTFVGLALLLLALERAEAGRPGLLWGLVPLGLVWANANSCFFLAPAVLLLHAAGARMEGDRPAARRSLTVAALLAPLVLATPSGTAALYYIGNHWRMPGLRPLQEYRVAVWPLDGPFFLLAGLLAGGALFRRRWRELLPAIALALLGARRIRFVAEFALVAGPAAAAGVQAAAVRFTAVLAARRRPVPAWIVGTAPFAVTAALLLLTAAPRLERLRAGEPCLELGEEAGLVPHAAIRFATENGLRGRMYNDLEVGSFLTWEGWPRWQVFQDPRINGYPESFHALLRRPDLSRETWQQLLDRFAVTAALVTFPAQNPRAALFASETWALVYRDAEALVFARRDAAAFGELVARRELPIRFAWDAESGVRPVPLRERPANAAASPCTWQHRLGDFQFERGETEAAWRSYREALAAPGCLSPAERDETRRTAAELALALGRPAAVVDLVSGLDDPTARRHRGLALLRLRNASAALIELQAVLAARPEDGDALFGRALALEHLGRPGEARTAWQMLLERAPHHVGAAEARSRLRPPGPR